MVGIASTRQLGARIYRISPASMDMVRVKSIVRLIEDVVRECIIRGGKRSIYSDACPVQRLYTILNTNRLPQYKWWLQVHYL